jgi:hypothetical protein
MLKRHSSDWAQRQKAISLYPFQKEKSWDSTTWFIIGRIDTTAWNQSLWMQSLGCAVCLFWGHDQSFLNGRVKTYNMAPSQQCSLLPHHFYFCLCIYSLYLMQMGSFYLNHTKRNRFFQQCVQQPSIHKGSFLPFFVYDCFLSPRRSMNVVLLERHVCGTALMTSVVCGG